MRQKIYSLLWVVFWIARFNAPSWASDSLENCEVLQPGLNPKTQIEAFETAIRTTKNESLLEAEKHASCFVEYATSIQDSVSLQRALLLLGNAEFKNHKTEESLEHFTQGLAIATDRNDKIGMMKITRVMGVSYHFTGEREKSKKYFLTALRLSEELKDTVNTAQVLLNLGLISTMVQEYQEALVYYQKALELPVIWDDPIKKCTVMQGLSIAYKGLGDIPNAKQYCLNALDLLQNMDNPFLEATITYSAAEIWEGENDSMAISYYEKAIDLYTQTEAHSQIIRVTLDFAEFLTQIGQIQKGISLLEPVVTNNEVTQNMDTDPDWYYSLSLLYFRNNELPKAEETIQKILKSKESLSAEFLEKSNYLLGETYQKQQKYKEASTFFQRSKIYGDSVNVLKKEDQLAELRVKYNTENNKKALGNLIELNKLKEEQKNRNKFYLLVVVGLLLVAIIAAVLLWRQAKIESVQSKKLSHEIAENRKKTEALLEANVKAKEGLRVKSEFISTISHEIRTPLTAILGMTNLVLDTAINSTQKGYLNTIQNSGRNLLVLVNDILDFSQMEESKLSINLQPTHLRGELNSVIKIYENQVREKGLEFSVDIDPEVPVGVKIDGPRLKQVLFNFLNNALKFTHQGFIKLEVKQLQRKGAEVLLRFQVSDSGIGIHEANQTGIFEAFKQVQSTNSRGFQGIGIGLAISKSILAQMGSEIKVKSVPGKGASFWFDLKTSVVTDGLVTGVQKLDDNLPKQKMGENCPMRILVVEDNPINQKLLNVNLKHMGYSPLLSSNGEEALSVLAEEKVDLIFMDIQMPVMDGLTAAKHIVDKYGKAKPIIVALTANAIADDKKNYLNAGMDDYISKPYKPHQIEDCIKKWYTSKYLVKMEELIS